MVRAVVTVIFRARVKVRINIRVKVFREMLRVKVGVL